VFIHVLVVDLPILDCEDEDEHENNEVPAWQHYAA
jgi:hypothetical protein